MSSLQRSNSPLKLLIWTVIPTHHQSAFFAAIRALDVDLVVHYYRRIMPDRVLLGWREPALAPGERHVRPSMGSLRMCPDWRDRIHILPGYNMPFLLLLPPWLSANRVTWLHWSEPSRRTLKSYFTYPVKRYYGALVNRFAAGALAMGEMAAHSFVEWGIRPAKIRFLPYAVSAPALSPAHVAPAPAGEALRFLFLGALCHRKAVDVLLRAFGTVLAECPSARLDLIGHDHSNGAYHRLANELNVARAVRIAPSVPAEQVGAFIAGCDVFVLPSRFDGWGMVVNEAAALGKPIISTDACGAARHLVLPGRNGFRVPAGNEAALAQAMLEYCRNPLLLTSHGRESKLLFRDFTPERNAQRLLEAIDSLLKAKQLPGGTLAGH